MFETTNQLFVCGNVADHFSGKQQHLMAGWPSGFNEKITLCNRNFWSPNGAIANVVVKTMVSSMVVDVLPLCLPLLIIIYHYEPS